MNKIGLGLSILISLTLPALAQTQRPGWFSSIVPLDLSSQREVARALGIQLPPVWEPGPGRVEAFAGNALHKVGQAGLQRVRWAFPVDTAYQHVDAASLRLLVMDGNGRSLD